MAKLTTLPTSVKIMTRIIILIILFLTCTSSNIFANKYDSLFIDSIKIFANKEFGVQLSSELYTKWSLTNNPDIYLVTSLKHKVQTPQRFPIYEIFSLNDPKLDSTIESYDNKGFVTFKYYAYCNSATILNERLLTYSKENISFVIFHELLHNYFIQEKINIPYDFNEAASDIIGNYCTLKYAKYFKQLDKSEINKMISINEKAYEIMNNYISKINQGSGNTDELCDLCNTELFALKKDYDLFQLDRYYHAVNTAYLLKNSHYCMNYFLLKRIFKKVNSVPEFLEILKNIPAIEQDREMYFDNFK